MIELKDIRKTYGSETAVDSLSLTIPNAETTVLIGPSGCGKSTLLRIINGLTKPDAGAVAVGGEQVTEENITELRHAMGYVIQEGGLFPHLTARENITIAAEYLKRQENEIEGRLQYLCELTNFPAEGVQKFPAELSGGQRQRVSLMRALMLDPEYLLLDEPLGALDPLIRYDLQTDLKTIFAELRKTVVLVTHDLAEAVFFGDTIVLMKDGKIEQMGTAKQLMEEPASQFVTDFVTAQRSHLET